MSNNVEYIKNGGMVDMKDVVLDEIKSLSEKHNKKEPFIKLLTKIYFDFIIFDYRDTIEDFLRH